MVCFSCYRRRRPLRLSLSSGIIENIVAEYQSRPAIVAYFYCDFRDESKKNCRNLVLSIILQLGCQSNLCYKTLFRVYSAHGNGARKSSDETLTKCLKEMVSLPDQGPIYLIVDAIDECPRNSYMSTPRTEVLNLVKNIVNLRLPNLHICITSRRELDIQSTLKPLALLRVPLHSQSGQKTDIMDYIRGIVNSEDNMRRWREEDRKLVIETLSERARRSDGT